MIPKIIHFIFGLKEDFGEKSFSFVHFLAVYTAWKVNNPDIIFLHYAFEPKGEWWDRAKPYLTLNKIDSPTEIFGNALNHYAHRADIIRLDMLKKYGGIYMDLDVLCINAFDPLLKYDFVMGLEPGVGLCNAVILSRPNARFLSIWYDEYRNFDNRLWNYHSVILPWKLAKKNPSECHIVNKYSFFYPMYNDPVHLYLFGSSVSVRLRIKTLLRNFAKFGLYLLGIKKTKTAFYTFHAIYGRKWHYRKVNRAYCVHLWGSRWWDRYLKSLTPEFILNDSSNFSELTKRLITEKELLTMCRNESINGAR